MRDFRLFKPPHDEDGLKSLQSVMLRIASMLLPVGAIFMFLYILLYPSTFARFFPIAVFLVAWQFVLLGLNRHGHTKLASWLYLSVGWVILTYYVYTGGGIKSANFSIYFAYIITAGILIDWTAGIILGVICALTGVLLIYLDHRQLLPAVGMQETDVGMFITYSLITVIIVSLQSVASYTVFKSLEKATRENEQRKLSEEKLLQQNEEFLSLNEELSESYRHLSTANKELEEARKKAEESDRLKTAFLANISHEIRTPMNAIIGFSQLLDSNIFSEEQKKQYIQLIRQRSGDLLAIIDDIFDISRLEIRQIELVKETGNINQLLEEICQDYLVRMEADQGRAVEIRPVRLLKAEHADIITDFKRVKQVVTNLVNNAIKFTEKGYVAFGCLLRTDNFLEFFVEDSGIGIDHGKQAYIFDRFRQAEENYLSKHFGGSGLGLSISKGLAELLGGNIWVESAPGKGSRFAFTIPYQPSKRDAGSGSDEVTPGHHWSGKAILVVEDDRFSAEFLRKLLQKTGALIFTGSTGEEARALFNSREFDLVLMDIRLPDTNGFDLTREFIQKRPGTRVIAQTAYTAEADKLEAMECGCIEVVTKPISVSLLMKGISKVLG